jgi:DNA-binding HxlR family transcriptional regulator
VVEYSAKGINIPYEVEVYTEVIIMAPIKKSTRPSPGTVEREKQKTVLRMLPDDGTKRRWYELEKEARALKMSLRTLRKNLNKLESSGIVLREVNTSERPPGVYYRRHILSPGIRYAVEGPEGGKSYDPDLAMKKSFEILDKEFSDLKKEDFDKARQKLSEIIKFNITTVFRDVTILFLREVQERSHDFGKDKLEEFSRWMDVLVYSRLESLLQLCIKHSDVTHHVREEIRDYYQHLSNKLFDDLF